MGSFGSASATTGVALTSSFLAGFASSSELESSEPEPDELEELAAAFFLAGFASDDDESESLPLEDELSAFLPFLVADFLEEALLTAEFFLTGLASDEELLSEESESLSLSTTFFFLDFSVDSFLFLLEPAEALEPALALLAGTFGASLELLLLLLEPELLELSSELSEASAASLAASSAAFFAASALALASAFFDFLSLYKWSTIV